jgi:hypothetical protein
VVSGVGKRVSVGIALGIGVIVAVGGVIGMAGAHLNSKPNSKNDAIVLFFMVHLSC